MRKIFLLSALSALAFTACEKDLYEDSASNPSTDEPKTIANMVVPQNFNWEMTQLVTARIATPVETAVRIFLDEECTADYMVAEFLANPEYVEPLVLAVPTAATKLYVKYGSTVEPVAISNHTASLTLEPSAAKTMAVKGVEDKPQYTIIIKPWSTLMFEDLFPKKGDYDFNDLVANYRTVAYYTTQGENNTKIHAIDIYLRVNAVGATLPITPYLKISNSAMNYFQKDKNIVSVLPGSSSGVGFEMVDDTHVGYFIMKFTEIADKPEGVTYLNTLEDVPLVTPKLLKLRIEDHNEGTKLEDGDYFIYDFFITNGTHEVHKRNFEPVLGLGYPATEIEGGAGIQKYSNGQNLVWGIDVPVVMNHAIEKTNFLDAYPDFYDWATSGGALNPSWYSNPVSSTLIDFNIDLPLFTEE